MKNRYGEITKDILSTLAFASVITIAATSPYFLINVARAVIKYKKYNKNKNYRVNDYNLSKSLAGLNKNKIIILKNENDKFTIKLTEKGKRVVKGILFDNMKIEKPQKWDKKWRIVVFDIPERKVGKHQRNLFRAKLQSVGFYQMQKSVWVCPYPCEKEVRLMCEIYEINPYVNIITAEEIYNADALIKHFKLPLNVR
ncbi:MAG: CRISPR-associated endonuclease Cas2 [Patescibacteria group bacterium]